jgi:hypothetical protein
MDEPASGVKHSKYVNTQWDELLMSTLNHCLGPAAMQYLFLDGLDGEASGDDAIVMKALVEATLTMVGELDLVRWVYSSFPWRFMMIQTGESNDLTGTCCSALTEWMAVLKYEAAHRNDQLGKIAPHTKSQPYRELMTVRFLELGYVTMFVGNSKANAKTRGTTENLCAFSETNDAHRTETNML